ncbi:MAG: SPOR domain-containing protein [Bacteroidetes bacterium]|nr:SPOR domain-containing protein [Bacteroidota bacterium]MBU1679820.1 SPOR domain-containing protein [Bacteroidota bacterium]MBU2507920.1 SPOR domain-containing protein [Bacteroidota bacterium]
MRNTSIIILCSLFLIGCAAQQIENKETVDTASTSEQVYIFDDVTVDTPVKEAVEDEVETQPAIEPIEFIEQKVELFIVQLGAFTSNERAAQFIKENKSKLNYEMNIHYSEDVNLYVVQLTPFRTRKEAEDVRNALWLKKEFKDSFIVPGK